MWPTNPSDVHPTPQAQPPSKRRPSEHNKNSSVTRSTPTTFFFRTEDELEQSSSPNSPSPALGNSSYGIQSLASNISSAHEDVEGTAGEAEPIDNQVEQDSSSSFADHASESMSTALAQEYLLHRTTSEHSNDSSPSRPSPRDISNTALSGRYTPLHLYSPAGGTESGPASTPKSASLRSLRLSDDGSGGDDAVSQAITSGDEYEENEVAVQPEESKEAPQLVMPNLRLPSRRPFTQRGKEIGKLKLLVAGAKGVGKTSLIKSIVQACEDIVHVDPLKSSSLSLNTSERRSSKQHISPQDSNGPGKITEISASTRAYPSWWSELGESRILRRRQSMGEQVLERNICFIDTPGFDSTSPFVPATKSIIEYVEASLRRNLSFASLSDGEVLSILSGNGGTQVDLVLYLFSGEPTVYDLDLIRQLSEFTLVVPVVSKADLFSEEELSQLSTSIATEMHNAEIIMTDLENPAPGENAASSNSRLTWSVSSANGNDDDNMDASLLMSPDYIRPLSPSNLPDLISQIFDPAKAAWLRHMAAKKFLCWRQTHSEHELNMTTRVVQVPSPNNVSTSAAIHASPVSSVLSLPSESQVLVSRPGSGQLNQNLQQQQPSYLSAAASPSPFSAARYADHTQREELLAQARLARWAADLQRSLQNERERFASLHREERQGWLLERWSETQQRDADRDRRPLADIADLLRPQLSKQNAEAAVTSAGTHRRTVDPLDPLGLLEWDERIRRNGLVMVKVLGGCGVLSAMVVWVLRHWGIAGAFATSYSPSSSWPHSWFGGSSE